MSKTTKIIVTDIEWDAPKDVICKLPTRIEIPITPENEHFLVDMWDEAQAISDYISDQTGWCHFGFCVDVEEVPQCVKKHFPRVKSF